MFTTVSTNLDTTTLGALLAQCERTGTDLSGTIAHAVTDWLGRQEGAAEAVAPHAVDRNAVGTRAGLCRGYQWKSLYLPEGTLLRSWRQGECRDAQVAGGRIMYGARSLSPNQFARAFAGSVRNAWKDLLIKRPGDVRFHSAWRLRADLAANEDASARCRAAGKPAGKPDKRAGKKAARRAEKMAANKAEKHGHRDAAPSIAPPPQSRHAVSLAGLAPERIATPGGGWDLPERRKLRFRLEDVAFE